MPKRQKKTKEDKILDCERPPPSLTLANFLDARLATASLCEESKHIENETSDDPADPNQSASATTPASASASASGPASASAQGPGGSTYTIRKNKKGNLPISYENRNKGKKVTVISNVCGDASELVSELKRLTGSGGVQKGECIELQGDRRDFVTQYLKGHPSVVQR